MKPRKAFILKTDHEQSTIYATAVAKSCDNIGFEWEYINWYQGQAELAWENIGVEKPKRVSGNEAAQCCFSGHIHIWKRIVDLGEPAVILEHDGMMLHKIEIDIPDNMMVMLGYKLETPEKYKHIEAGPPREIIDVHGGGHEGSHAYALSPDTAQKLIDHVYENGAIAAIDNRYFLKSRKVDVPIKIMSPTPAIGWIRASTIQPNNISATRNYEFIETFKNHFV